MRARCTWLLACAVLAGCPGPDTPPDAQTDGAGPDAPLTAPYLPLGPDLPEAPAPPALPSLTPCPDRFRESLVAPDVTVCEPWPDGDAPAACAEDSAHFPGEPGCTRLGSSCPAPGEWATDLPSDRPVFYVRAGATGGDGSRTTPFAMISDAATAALRSGSPAVVALARGTYDERPTIINDTTLWGACASDTRITSSTIRTDCCGGILTLIAEAGRVVGAREVTVGSGPLDTGPSAGGLNASAIMVQTSTDADIEHVIVEDVDGPGILLREWSHARVRSAVVRRTALGRQSGGRQRLLRVLAGVVPCRHP